MEIVCNKCGGNNICTLQPELAEKLPKKMTEVSNFATTPLVYKMTTLKCKDCGFEHSY